VRKANFFSQFTLIAIKILYKENWVSSAWERLTSWMTGAVIPAIISTLQSRTFGLPYSLESIRSKVLHEQVFILRRKLWNDPRACYSFIRVSIDAVSTATNLRKNTSAFVQNNREKAQVYFNCFLKTTNYNSRIDLDAIIFAMKMIHEKNSFAEVAKNFVTENNLVILSK